MPTLVGQVKSGRYLEITKVELVSGRRTWRYSKRPKKSCVRSVLLGIRLQYEKFHQCSTGK